MSCGDYIDPKSPMRVVCREGLFSTSCKFLQYRKVIYKCTKGLRVIRGDRSVKECPLYVPQKDR